jgi:hypothetical protein
LPPGPYTVAGRQAGFRDFEAGGLVQSEDGSLGYRMDNGRITDLPLQSRNVVAPVTLGLARGAHPPINGSRSVNVGQDSCRWDLPMRLTGQETSEQDAR